ncbi:TetR/AcrR family transcriptional regulator [Candidatus Pantoea formicae]|uniref:TetR/AcrR family transcriptional regulator n=1 Tax=Candidatus Pantoea formicae TaxID=2608355 RepID=UPI003ED9E155
MNNEPQQRQSQPRTKPAEIRLDELMDAALALFINKGFEATTISEIVRDAGVAKGTFYHYFSSKNEMLAALRARFTGHFIEKIQHALDVLPAQDGIARLQAWCHASVAAYVEDMAIHDALYHDHHYQTRGNPDRDAILNQIERILDQGKHVGNWQLEDSKLTAILMYQGMHGAVDNMMAEDKQEPERLSEALAQAFTRLLGCN